MFYKLIECGVIVESSSSGSLHLDQTGLLLMSQILAGHCQARGFEVIGLSLQVAPFP